MSVRLASNNTRPVRRVRAGAVPEDTAYHAPVDLGPGVSKRQAPAPFTFGPASNDEDIGHYASLLEDIAITACVLVVIVIASIAVYLAPDLFGLIATWGNLK